MIKSYLISKALFKPTREIVFIPVGGAKGVKPVVSILQGTSDSLPTVLLDSDKTGKLFQKNLKNGFYTSHKDQIIETDTFCDKEGSEIEDLMPLELLIDCFEHLIRAEERLEIENINAKKSIVPQLEHFAENNHIELKKGWKVDLSKMVKQRFNGEVSKDLEEKWEALLNTTQCN